VAQNLAMAVEAAGGGDVGSLLEGAGLVAVKDTLAGALSGGERRRLDMARCLATGAKVLLLDEPFAAVDPQGVAELRSWMREIAAQGMGMLVTDHAVRATLGTCDRAIVLVEGQVLASGSPLEIGANEAVRARYLGADFSSPSAGGIG
jgi:lipopolysaccharide export system ATP-binding protein